jgi:hypothetical protein
VYDQREAKIVFLSIDVEMLKERSGLDNVRGSLHSFCFVFRVIIYLQSLLPQPLCL